LILDSNIGRLTSDEKRAQLEWLESTLTAATTSAWRIVVAHHPLFSNGNNPEDRYLIDNWGRLFQKHRVDFYICGHDHSLQHLEVDGWPTSFLISAGGGAKLQPIRGAHYGPFSRSLHGFLHLRLTPDEALGTFVSVDGAVAHQFTRSKSGKVRVFLSTGRDRPQPKKEGLEEDP
jgi:3',5'-cyclic AMP phosphodiesterase CpdA